MEKVLTEEGKYCIFIKSVITEITEQAAVAQYRNYTSWKMSC